MLFHISNNYKSNSTLRLLISVFITPLILIGCQPTLTLEEAQQVALTTSSIPLHPPARNLNDVREKYSRVNEIIGPCSGNYLEEVKSALRAEPTQIFEARRDIAWVDNANLMRKTNEAYMLGLFPEALETSKRVQKAFIGKQVSKSSSKVSIDYMVARYYAFMGDLDKAKEEKYRGDDRRGGIQYAKNKSQVPYVDTHAYAATASIAHAEGRYSTAEFYYEKALDNYSKYSREAARTASSKQTYFEKHILTADLADVIARQGRLVEAEIKIRQLLDSEFSKGRYRSNKLRKAYLLRQLAYILFNQGRYQDAQWIAEKTVALYDTLCATKGSVFVAQAKQMLAESHAAQARWQDAVQVFESIHTDLAQENPHIFNRFFKSNIDWAISLIMLARGDEAVNLLKAALSDNEKNKDSDGVETAEIKAFLGTALFLSNDHSNALENFQQSISILTTAPEYKDNKVNSRRLVIAIESYMALLDEVKKTVLVSGLNVSEIMFQLSQWALNSTTQSALSASSARTAAKDPTLVGLIRKEQDIKFRIDSLKTQALHSASDGSKSNNSATDSIQQLASLKAAQSALFNEIEDQFPDYAGIINPKAASFREVQQVMHKDEALLTIYPSKNKTYVWAIPASGTPAFKSTTELTRDSIKTIVLNLRQSLSPNPPPELLGDIPPFDTDAAYNLYSQILGSVASGWQNAQTLHIVSGGMLAQLPLSVLPTAPVQLPAEKGALFSRYKTVPWLINKVALVPV